jgi:uncharacterized protein YheU (UPF0270 family)
MQREDADRTEPSPHVTVPWRDISPPALRGLIESFVLREGTDYGEREYSLAQKVAQIERQLASGEAEVVFDPDSGSASIVVARPRPARD